MVTAAERETDTSQMGAGCVTDTERETGNVKQTWLTITGLTINGTKCNGNRNNIKRHRQTGVISSISADRMFRQTALSGGNNNGMVQQFFT